MNKPRIRIILCAAVTIAIMAVFISELMNIQIVEAESYRKMVGDSSLHKQVIKATRGEIVAKNGSSFAENRMCFDVIIDKAWFPVKRDNEIILELTKLLQKLGETWIDNLPITKTTPFEYLPDSDSEIARLKAFLNLQEYATAADVCFQLEKRYGLEEFSTADARTVAGVQYEMEQRDFNYSTPYTFANDVQMSSVIEIKERSYLLSGVDIVESSVRVNPMGELAPHLIGLTGPIYKEEYEELKKKGYAMNDVIGKSGSELAFEEYLRGTDGVREIFCDADGNAIDAVESTSPVPGNTVVLTIDEDLQREAQEALERQITYLQQTAPAQKGREANHGAAVVVEVKTGKVLACATYPSYDLNSYLKDYSKLVKDEENSPLLNRALQGIYAPGSCFKPVVGTVGLGEGTIVAGSAYTCGHVFMLPGSSQRFTCLGTHGPINLMNALRVSCNIFFYNAGLYTGIDKVDETAKFYGLGEPTGIELKEKVGQRSNPESKMNQGDGEWFPGDTLQSSIGQLYHQFTPIQLANYAATIANRGTRMKLTFVDEIRDYTQQNVIKPFEPVVAAASPYPREVFESVIQGMIAASSPSGTAMVFNNYPITVASKTGTPETADLCNSTFICFAPAEDPQIAIAVVIENGWHGYTAAPVAKDLFNKYFGF